MPFHDVLSAPVVTVTRMVTVAAGRFAPDHLGELTAVVPFELIDAVLSETRSVQKRLRILPSRGGVYFLLAMCLFPEVGYRLVWDKLLTSALQGDGGGRSRERAVPARNPSRTSRLRRASARPSPCASTSRR
ncbi:transposase domain-containing protein [Streptomyces sp. NPDC102467]|uniref:transposase domain-containing protein n=1 Tax=Streptomyces sp. NPDC102467 TaxID=3366179 RepID=UPI00381E4124